MIPRSLRRTLLAAVCLAATARSASATTYYATDGHHEWRSIAVDRPLTGHLAIEQVLNRADGRARVVAVAFRFPENTPPPLADCARLLQRTFSSGAGPVTLDDSTTALGRPGHTLRFPLVRDGQSFACEVFVYADGPEVHGLVCASEVRPGDEGAAPSLLPRLHRDAARAPGVVALAPLRVAENAISSFPLSFKIFAHRETHRVAQLVVTEVWPTRPGAFSGNFARGDDTSAIEVGDTVVAIDGRPVGEFNSAMGRDTELGRIFLNRDVGAEVHLEFRSARTHETYDVTLQVQPIIGVFGH